MNLQAGCGTHTDVGAVSVCANFGFTQGVDAQLAMNGRWLGAGKMSQTAGKPLNQCQFACICNLGWGLGCLLLSGRVPRPGVRNADV